MYSTMHMMYPFKSEGGTGKYGVTPLKQLYRRLSLMSATDNVDAAAALSNKGKMTMQNFFVFSLVLILNNLIFFRYFVMLILFFLDDVLTSVMFAL